VNDIASPLTVVVLSCGDLGIEVSNRLARLPEVRSVMLVTAPYRRRALTLTGKIRHVWRTQGPRGLPSVAAEKLRTALGRGNTAGEGPAADAPPVVLDEGIERLQVPDFHVESCRAAIRERAPDLGVIAGTYILRPEVFEIPRLGSINLHSGKAPEYRGAAPAFWELYNGEREVGITIHRVVAALDAGNVLIQETFPLDTAPAGDPLEYLERYRNEVLRPNGVRLLADAVAAIAHETTRERAQDTSKAMTYRTPDYKAIRELRRRVAARRRGAHST
jgi:methionyl-tRNA formyltransferase